MILHLHSTKIKNVGYISSNRSGVDHIYSAVKICKSQIGLLLKNAETGAAMINSRVAILI
jgi:hypothetical protein